MSPRPIRLTSAAKQDLFEARHWYLEEAPGVDQRFRKDLRATLESIATHPEMYPAIRQSVRRANLNRFPYAVLYIIRINEIQVVGVVHHARHPRHWKRR